jgi:hypothetical protein
MSQVSMCLRYQWYQESENAHLSVSIYRSRIDRDCTPPAPKPRTIRHKMFKAKMLSASSRLRRRRDRVSATDRYRENQCRLYAFSTKRWVCIILALLSAVSIAPIEKFRRDRSHTLDRPVRNSDSTAFIS